MFVFAKQQSIRGIPGEFGRYRDYFQPRVVVFGDAQCRDDSDSEASCDVVLERLDRAYLEGHVERQVQSLEGFLEPVVLQLHLRGHERVARHHLFV